MAEAPPSEVASTSPSATPVPHPDGRSAVLNTADASSAQQSHEMVSSLFQAVNAQAGPKNGVHSGDGTPPTASSQPGATPAVARSGSQTPQTSSKAKSAPSHTDGLDGTMTETATYGTRSRNRTGNARPNYAEDQEIDFEISSAAATKKKGTHESANVAQAPADSKRADDPTRFVAAHPKEATPTVSEGPVTSSKKRKAVGGMPQKSHMPSTTSAPSAMKKLANSAASMMARETNMMTFSKHKSCLSKKGELIADDGTKLCVDDHVYLVCEPPGDPYYLCRIMEFLHVDSDNPNSPVDSIRVNWYYRPRDVLRFNNDSRLVYGTMHSDMCPLTSLRGKCTIKHKAEIEDLDAYRKERDCFYFSQVFDRFIRRWYECIPVSQIINVPEKVKKALDEQWKFVIVEIGRVKELTSAVKSCKRCAKYCASQDSVDCAICKNSYHMNCVQPPLPKKPSRGFAWACGPCSRASERKMEARDSPSQSGDVTEAEEELVEEEPAVSNDTTRAPSPSGDEMAVDEHPATQAEIALAKMWPMRYLGIHCRVEDALQYDDRAIYPRASSRLGPRHQANVNMWHGHPVELVKPAEIKKRYNKGSGGYKKDNKFNKEAAAALEADREERAKRPKWVQDEPPGYVARGEDYPNDDPRCTAKLLFKMPEQGTQAEKEQFVDDYVKSAKSYARVIGVPPFGINFLDKAMELLTACNYDVDAALNKLAKVDRKKDLHEPVLTKAELQKFEEGVAKYGSEHRLVRLHMKTNLPNSDIVRFYYLWKKTPKGKEIWGNYGGRKGSKNQIENDSGARLQVELSHDVDDSAFDNDKAARRNRGFICKFCNTIHSRQWRRAPGVSAGQTLLTDAKSGNKDKKDRLVLALCLRCAGLWRKYAIQWEDIDEVAKKVSQSSGRAWKRKIDEELLRELIAANEAANMSAQEPPNALPSIEQQNEPPKKKTKTDNAAAPPPEPKKKEKPPPAPKEVTPPLPPVVPGQPQWRALPCAVCKAQDDTIECIYCKLTVHRHCFGLDENEGVRANGSVSWTCEQCHNDRHPEVSTDYACCLCLTEETDVDLVEPPRVSHKKKTDRERERERLEKEIADGMRAEYRSKQLAQHRPVIPREPLKKTIGNNWIHVYCAVWTPEVRFSDARKLEVAEGFQLIPPARYEAICKLCKNKGHDGKVREEAGACVSCFQCHANFHASCAMEAGYQFGFDVTPVKGSRKDQITTATLGEETGSLTAAIWCKEHVVKSIIHPMNEVVDETGKTALQAYVENYKQADLTLTGTVRKANLAQLTKEKSQQAAPATQNGSRRESAANSIAAAVRRGARTSSAAETKREAEDGATQISDVPSISAERRCVKCKIDVTPRWHLVVKEPPKELTSSATSPQGQSSSTALGENAERERQRLHEAGRPVTGVPPHVDSLRPSQNIRFMPPGVGGRAWDGMPDRFAPAPAINGDARPSDQPAASLSAFPSRETAAPETNGGRLPSEKNGAEDGFQNQSLPRYQNAASAVTPPGAETSASAASPQEFLCHKCFIKKKINPTPSPPPRPPEPALSPRAQFPVQPDWTRPPGPPPQALRDGPIRMPWDDLPRQTWPPPPHINGIGPQAPAFGSHVVSQGPGYSPYGSQPNGYHVPPHAPPHHGPPPGLAPIREREPSFSRAPPPHPPPPAAPPGAPPVPPSAAGPPHYGPHALPRQSPISGFPATSQPIPNGIHSPHTGHPPLQSPPYGPSLAQQHQQYPSRRTESPFTSQLPSIGQPLHSSPPPAFNRPDARPHGLPAPPQQAMAQPPPQPSPTTLPDQPPHASPHVDQPRPASRHGQTATPRESQSNGTPGPGGASASPSLRNLLH